jgi:folate-dependent tRNA-U54 methylase TrmFO/GidA
LRDDTSPDFQPQNVTFAYFAPLETSIRDKKARRHALAERALAAIDEIAAQRERERLTPAGT